jgi:hypothetical protein
MMVLNAHSMFLPRKQISREISDFRPRSDQDFAVLSLDLFVRSSCDGRLQYGHMVHRKNDNGY